MPSRVGAVGDRGGVADLPENVDVRIICLVLLFCLGHLDALARIIPLYFIAPAHYRDDVVCTL